MKFTRSALETLYKRYDDRTFVHPDPLETLYSYNNPEDLEVVGLIASGLAYGRVAQILKSIAAVLSKMDSPYEFITTTSKSRMQKRFNGFKHRFTTDDELVGLLLGIKHTLRTYGSLENCFLEGVKHLEQPVLPGLHHLSDTLLVHSPGNQNSLLPHPKKGSACKRLNLFLRWMVRNDNVDLGIWTGVSPGDLIVPLDTHMHKIALTHGLTNRKNSSLSTALEITRGFARFSPNDPVRYDFALTRPGIWTTHNQVPKLSV